jgi:CheY-like chemotaxis protein
MQGAMTVNQTILIVDDNVDTRELLHLYLTKADYTVLVAADGGDGGARQADGLNPTRGSSASVIGSALSHKNHR